MGKSIATEIERVIHKIYDELCEVAQTNEEVSIRGAHNRRKQSDDMVRVRLLYAVLRSQEHRLKGAYFYRIGGVLMIRPLTKEANEYD